jgi:ArsR family transcriptional regulator, arsenate/arsenite/antimonite-responsive transcriptional repressor
MTQMQNVFSALADSTRQRLLNLMRDGEVCVLDFTEVLKVSQPKISRHLACLRRSGLVSTRRGGKWIYYRIADLDEPSAARLLDAALDWMKSDRAMREDYRSLKSIFSPSAPVPPDVPVEPRETARGRDSRQELETFLL